jgi:HPt (histidine-containing phosphotransfer) domain-containing protein
MPLRIRVSDPRGSLTEGSDLEEQPVLDAAVLERLLGWVGRDRVAQLIGLFLESSSGRVSDVRSGLADGEAQRIERAAHSLKSSAGNLGASRLHFLAAQLEEVAAGGLSPPLVELVDTLVEVHAETCRRLVDLGISETAP